MFGCRLLLQKRLRQLLNKRISLSTTFLHAQVPSHVVISRCVSERERDPWTHLWEPFTRSPGLSFERQDVALREEREGTQGERDRERERERGRNCPSPTSFNICVYTRKHTHTQETCDKYRLKSHWTSSCVFSSTGNIPAGAGKGACSKRYLTQPCWRVPNGRPEPQFPTAGLHLDFCSQAFA